jgi:hypothetical protein
MKFAKYIIAAIVIGISVFIYKNREVTTWVITAPTEIVGHWNKIETRYAGGNRIREIVISSQSISITRISDEKTITETFPILKAAVCQKIDSETGKMILFFGKHNNSYIADNRYEIIFGRLKKISVQEIVDDGTGSDRYYEIGEFVEI